MDKLLTFAEVDQLFPNEWVLLAVNPCEASPDGTPLASVICHSADEGSVWERAGRWEEPEQAVRYTGGLDPNVVYAL